MKKSKGIISALTLTLYVFSVSCHRHHGDEEEIGHHHHSHEHISALSENSTEEHHDGLIVIEPDDAESMGIEVESADYSNFSETKRMSGSLEAIPSDTYLCVSRSAGIVRLTPNIMPGMSVSKGMIIGTVSAQGVEGGDANQAAYQAMEAAKRELNRLKPLHDEGIVSTRDYNSAEAAYNQAKAAYSGTTSGSTIVSGIAGTVEELYVKDGQYVGAGEPIARIAKGDKILLRVDVPAVDINLVKSGMNGNVKIVGNESIYTFSGLNAKQLTDRPLTMQGAYIPVYFVLDNRPEMVAGMSVEVYVGNTRREGVMTVPLTAVSEQQGVYFVYKRLDEDCYRKMPVKLGNNNGIRVEILDGVDKGDDIVSKGMIFVKLAESNGAVPEGHSHSH